MPEAPAITPPAAPPAAPSPPSQINVSEMPTPVAPAKPPKPGSARDRLRQDIQKKFGGETQPPAPTPAARADAKPAAPEIKPAAGEESTPPPAAPPEKLVAAKPPEATPDTKKPSPWKLVDQFKERAARAEQRVLELEKEIGPEPERQAKSQRLEAAEKRLAELEQHIRFVDYSKSKEFQDQYQKPYEEAWGRAMSELKEITLEDPNTHQRRAVADADLVELVNLPLGRAREIADQVFGPFADDIMAHRKAIRELFEKQHSALEKAKTEGATREAQVREKIQKFQSQIQSSVKQTWDTVNSTILSDEQAGSFFKPRDGDEEWNARLEKGFKLVDQAFAENPMDPRLTPEQRKAIIERHAFVRNRAAGWGALRNENHRLNKKVAELESALKQYKESTPSPAPTTGRPSVVTVSGGGRVRESIMGELQKLAK